jgi:hypothetical protein
MPCEARTNGCPDVLSVGTARNPALVATRQAHRDPAWPDAAKKGPAGSYVIRGPVAAGIPPSTALDNAWSELGSVRLMTAGRTATLVMQ